MHCRSRFLSLLAGLLAALLVAPQALAEEALPSGEIWLQHVCRDLLPFWESPDALGSPVGEFPTFRCNDGRLFDAHSPCPELANPPDWIKPEIGREYLRMRARQTFAYGVAFHLTGDPRWLDAARAGARATLRWLDPERGAPAWIKEGRTARFEETTAQDQSYAVVGIAMLYYLTRDPELERALVAHEKFIFKAFWDGEQLRWLPNGVAGEEASRQELVAQLDQLNAFMLLVTPYLPATERARWRTDIRRLCDVIVKRYHDPQSGYFFGTRGNPGSGKPGSRHNDFGHTIKSFWMLTLAARELGDGQLEAFAKQGARKVLERAWVAQTRSWGSQWTGNGIDENKQWWIYAELDQMATTLALEDVGLAHRLAGSWDFWLKHLVDHKSGEVWGWVQADGWVPPDMLKIHQWKSGYHSFEHALVSYLGAQALAGRPATLHFATGHADSVFRPYLLPGSVVEVKTEGPYEAVSFRLSRPNP